MIEESHQPSHLGPMIMLSTLCSFVASIIGTIVLILWLAFTHEKTSDYTLSFPEIAYAMGMLGLVFSMMIGWPLLVMLFAPMTWSKREDIRENPIIAMLSLAAVGVFLGYMIGGVMGSGLEPVGVIYGASFSVCWFLFLSRAASMIDKLN